MSSVKMEEEEEEEEEEVVVVVVVEVDEKAAVVTVGRRPIIGSLFCLLPMRFVGAFFFPGWAPPPPPPRSSYRRVSQISQFERLYELRNVHAARPLLGCLPGALHERCLIAVGKRRG